MVGMTDETRDAPRPSARTALTRSRRQKMIAGVCGGAGRCFGIDPVVFRVVLAVLALSGGIGLVAYGIGWLLIPMEGEDETELRRLLSGRVEGPGVAAVLCALGGSALFLSNVDNGDTELFSVLLLGALGAAVYGSRQRRAGGGAGPEGDVPVGAAASVSGTPPAAGPPPATAPSWWREPRPGAYLWGPEDGPRDEPEGPAGARVRFEKDLGDAGRDVGRDFGRDFAGRFGRDGVPGPEDHGGWIRPPRHNRPLFGLASFLLAVAAAAVAGALSWHRHPLGTTLEIALVAALGVLGVSLVLGALLGRSGGGTVFWALVASALLVGAAALPKSVGPSWSVTTWQPAGATHLRPRYTLGAGRGTLDLTGLNLRGGTATTSADVGAGDLLVRVPRDATVRLTARVGLGDLRLPGSGPHGVEVAPGRTRTVTLAPPAGQPSGGTVVLTATVSVGQLEVVRDQP